MKIFLGMILIVILSAALSDTLLKMVLMGLLVVLVCYIAVSILLAVMMNKHIKSIDGEDNKPLDAPNGAGKIS